MTGYKVFTHDWRSPIQGGAPVLPASPRFPVQLPTVTLDTSGAECGAGWNFCIDLATALRIGGLCPTGRLSRVCHVDAPGAITRGDKSRAATVTLVAELSEAEIKEGIVQLSAPFGVHRDAMVAEQCAWRAALARLVHDAEAVELALRKMLVARDETRTLRRVEKVSAWAAWAAWDAWAARAAPASRAAWAAWDARTARAAWNALVHTFAALSSWITAPADRLTRGIREAYACGLGELGIAPDGALVWSMDEAPR